MQKVFRRCLTFSLIVILALGAAIVCAKPQFFDGTGQYIMSDFENHDIAKQRAQQRAERDAQKKAGVVLKTFSRSINSELADEEISAVMNNIIKVSDVKIVPVPFEAKGEAGLMYRATLKAEIDTDGVYAWLKRDDKEKVTIIQQNDSLQNAIQKNDELAEKLTKQYNRAKTKEEKNRIQKQIENNDREFLANQKYKEGYKLYGEGKYNDAIILYSEAIEINPNYAEAYLDRGIVYRKQRKFNLAVEDIKKSIEIDPKNARSWDWLGMIYGHGLKDYEQAIYCYSKCIELRPDDASGYRNRAYWYNKTKNYSKAIDDYNKAIDLIQNNKSTSSRVINNEKLAFFYIGRAQNYLETKNYAKALDDYAKSIQYAPNRSSNYSGRALVYERMGNYNAAIEDYNKFLELEPNNGWFYYARADAYAKSGNYRKAIEDCEIALKHEVNAWNKKYYYRNMSNYYKALGDSANAQACLAKAKEFE